MLRPIGRVESPLIDLDEAPKQGFEGAPEAWLVFDDGVREALRDLQVGDEIFVLTWLHRARRDVLVVHPRDDPGRPQQGVFSTRSSDRPNPVGLHRVEIAAVDGTRICVRNLEAVDATPVVDIKPVLRLGTEF
jgi:tRNA-Thr(GGU) m(6)t(6)A37 methyltransferase TsaA